MLSFIKIWGEAYHHAGVSHAPLGGLFSFVTSDVGGIEWPDTLEHPLFYVGIYAAIRLGTAFIDVCTVFMKYTGSLRASRILFK